jgi:hypothetical protein
MEGGGRSWIREMRRAMKTPLYRLERVQNLSPSHISQAMLGSRAMTKCLTMRILTRKGHVTTERKQMTRSQRCRADFACSQTAPN